MAKRSFENIMRAAGAATAKLRRDHLPGPAAVLSATSITVALDAAELQALDAWVAKQPDPKPRREDAALRLLRAALARDGFG